jgi:hypothetical protein
MASADAHTPAESGDEDTSTNPPSLTRRQFVAGTAGAAATAAAGGFSTTATAETDEPVETADTAESPHQLPADGKPPYGRARISTEGYRELAEAERAQQQKGNTLQFSKRVDAVKDLGLDPTGSQPIEDTLNSKMESGMLVVLPPGTYRATDEIRPGVEGKCGIVGAGYKKSKQPPKPGNNSVVINVESDGPITLFNIGPVSAGLFGNVVIDQRKPRPHGGVTVRSSGNVRVRDIRIVGAQTQVTGADDNPGFFTPMAKGSDSLVVFERCIARGGGIPGTKNIGGTFGVGVFGRQGPRGTVVLKDCIVENMADNGIYGARTGAKVRVLGGLYRNNDVSQARVNGDARIDGVDVVIDEKHYSGLKSKSYGQERGPGWPATNGIKIETKSSISEGTGTPVKNCNLVAKTVSDTSTLGSLVHIWDSAGAVTLENTRITNNLPGTTSVYAEEPGSGTYAAAPKPWRFMMKNSVVQGKGAGQDGPAVDIRGRPRSLVTGTCFKYPGASKDDIDGAGVSSCGFGKNCTSAGLKAPKKVGSGGNSGTIPVNVSYNGSASASTGSSGGRLLGWAGKLLAGMAVAPLIAVAITVLPIILGLLVIGGVTFGGLFLFFKKFAG